MKKQKLPRLMKIINMGNNSCSNPCLLRVIAAPEFTRIDFGYAASDIYNRGGWIDIWPETYLSTNTSANRIPLKKVQNVPLSPEKLNFESMQDWCCYTLFFEPIPIQNCKINIIESENPSPNNFNFYDIELEVGEEVVFKMD
jgi:hypothetical protein